MFSPVRVGLNYSGPREILCWLFPLISLFTRLLENSSDSEAQNKLFSDRRRRSKDLSYPVTTSLPTLESTTEYWNDKWPDDEDGENIDDDEHENLFEDPAELDPSFLRREEIAVLMAREDKKVLSKLGHHFEDMVLSCTYRGISCRSIFVQITEQRRRLWAVFESSLRTPEKSEQWPEKRLRFQANFYPPPAVRIKS